MKVYLAGPAVFRPNAGAIGAHLKSLCVALGLEGVFPFDGGGPSSLASDIYRANCALITSCVAVVADISPFRGPHMDVGTSWEIGCAVALGKPVFAYVDSSRGDAWVATGGKVRKLIDRIWCEETPTGWRDAHGDLVEDYDLAENLMVACSIMGLSTSADVALRRCAEALLKRSS